MPPITEYDLFAPSGRLYRFRRQRLGDRLALAAALAASAVLWVVILWPVIEWVAR